MNRRVSVWKYVKIGDRWRYCKLVCGANNKIKPHWVYVNGKPEEHPEGNFYIHKLDHGRQVWKKIGPNPADAVRAAEYEESLLSAIAAGLPILRRKPLPTSTTAPRCGSSSKTTSSARATSPTH